MYLKNYFCVLSRLLIQCPLRAGGWRWGGGLLNSEKTLRVIKCICPWSLNYTVTLIKTEKSIFSTMAKRHQFMLYLHDVKYFYLYHLSPQMFSIEGIALEFLDFLQNRAIKVQLPIENDETLTRASVLIYQGQMNFSGNVVFIRFISDEYLIGLVNFLISHNRQFFGFVKYFNHNVMIHAIIYARFAK